MWLHRAMPLISSLAVRSYYRVTVGGAQLPVSGPVLVVANHNNALVDPPLVVIAAGRTVRFLTKAPLFDDKAIGWLVAAVGSVPVYRQQDDPTKLSQNLDSFRDVHAALANGDVVGIFPEGITHSASSLAPLKTGAARIAFGASRKLGRAFPIVAMGLVFRDRDAFGSEAHAIVSEPLEWDDLVGAAETRGAVRELTARIEAKMRSVTLNLERWEDAPLVRAAEDVWRAEFSGSREATAQLDRLRYTAEALSALRDASATEGGAPGGASDVSSTDWRETANELRAHAQQLAALRLTPAKLKSKPPLGESVRWTLVHLPIVLLLPISLSGALFFWLPKWITVRVADKLTVAEGPEALVTHRVLVGAVVFNVWFAIAAAASWVFAGWGWALLALLIQPLWAYAALAVGERRRVAWATVKRFFLRRRERARVDALRAQQERLALRLRSLYQRVGERVSDRISGT